MNKKVYPKISKAPFIPNNMLDKWEKILVTEMSSKAEITRMVLENNGIQAVLLNKKDSSYLLGVFEIYVPVEQAAIARQVLDNETTN